MQLTPKLKEKRKKKEIEFAKWTSVSFKLKGFLGQKSRVISHTNTPIRGMVV